jgi:hypothetical protein
MAMHRLSRFWRAAYWGLVVERPDQGAKVRRQGVIYEITLVSSANAGESAASVGAAAPTRMEITPPACSPSWQLLRNP